MLNAVKFATAGFLIAWSTPGSGQIVTQPPVPEWIQLPGGATHELAFFRKSFQARLPLLKAILLGACDGKMSIFLNGQSVGEISGRERAASLDVTRYIIQGPNVLAIETRNSLGTNAFSLLLELNGDFARKEWVASDSSWLVSGRETSDWKLLDFGTNGWIAAGSVGRVDAGPGANPFDPKGAFDAYDSWKLALGTNVATDPGGFTLLPGFKAELLRSARPEEGSWIALAFDPQGRLTIAREKRGLIRLSGLVGQASSAEVIEDTLLECRGLLYAHGALYVNANNSKGFYRLRDTKGDGHFDEVKLLLRTEGGVGHGRNHVVLGPDGSLYLVHGNNVSLTGQVATNSPLRNYESDALIPCPFDDAMFDGDVLLPAGHILRTDPDGKSFALFAGGFRNPLDIAFNRDGEMFTFDADMEWDVGSPWYRPNRVNHVISGADFGWRRGTAKWPDYLPDTLPSTLDVGLASPTGIEFGIGSHFPPPYNEALFISDWAYGRILAVHLRPEGASYTANSELFVSGRPLNVTDVTFGPDGAMYFVTGGRGTQSGLYRISYVEPRVEPEPKTLADRRKESKAKAARELRHQLESLHGSTLMGQASSLPSGHLARELPNSGKTPAPLPGKDAVTFIWPNLGHADTHIRHAARVALEHQDVHLWQARALAEKRAGIALTALLALTHVGGREMQPPILERLNRWPFSRLNDAQQLEALRIYEVACARWGKPLSEMRLAMRHTLDPLYPSHDWHLNHRLCSLLVYLESPSVIARTLEMASRAERPEDLMQYLFFLRYVREGWTLSQREAYFRALEQAEQKQGARDYYSVLKRVRDESIASLSNTEQDTLRPILARLAPVTVKLNTNAAPGQFVREWRMEDFDLSQPLRGRSFKYGKAAFTNAQCNVCHRFGNEGGFVGPDLSAVGSRFDTRAVLESLLEPSKVIDEKSRNTVFSLTDGNSLVGTVEREDGEKVLVREGPFADKPVELLKQNIVRREPSTVSPMPTGLANVLQREQVLDLLAFLGSGGDTNHSCFKAGGPSPAPASKRMVPDASGVVTLLARDAITHGATMRYEPATNKNCLGFWVNPKDWAEWDFALAQPGTFEVEVWQGCGKGQGGSDVMVEVGAQQFSFIVEETGHFQIFLPRRVGRVQFAVAGTYSLALKPQHKQAGAVMDIQKVRLVPVKPHEAGAPAAKSILNARRVVFLGDSITYAGHYVEFIELYLRTRFPAATVELLDLGLPSETVSGLSEPGHAGGSFPRPDLHERLGRVLEKARPDLVIACYGMNDGVYYPFGEERFQKFQEGIKKLRDRAAASGAKVIHLTPPSFDSMPLKGHTLPAGLTEYPSAYEGYNEVLDRCSEWLLAQRSQGWEVVDIHGPMNRSLVEHRRDNPGFLLAGDGVHPNAQGHWLIAREFLRYLGAPEEMVSHDTPDALLNSHPRSDAILKLVRQRQGDLKDAWLTHVGHLRPGMNKGKPLPDAETEARDLTAKIYSLADVQFPGKRSRWFGFDRYDFEVDGKPVLVVAPVRAAPGRPWAWHGEFFGHKPNPDLALLGRGFHIVYMSVPDMLGCPAAVEHWNALYRELVEKYGFAKKAALVGLSRGGLYCYNWAAAHPGHVACIYGDAPVCDFKSWPGAFGKGKRSDHDWQLVLERYGFNSDAEARAYPKNPVDNLAPLAAAQVPLLHVYGDADEVVPWDENTAVIAERYRKLGGSISLIAKPGVNHHPHGLDDSTPIVDFIWQHAANPEAKAWLSKHGGGPLDAESRPLIRKLGAVDLDLVETTLVVFHGKLYRFEWVREGYWNNQRKTNYFRFIDHDTGEATAPFADGHEFGSAFVDGDMVYVTGTQGRSRVNMFASRDLKTWDSWPVLADARYGIFNTSLCKAGQEYVLMFEIDHPAEETGVPFTARFTKSPDLRAWTLTPPECNYAKDRYTAPHCLRWLDGWFYDFYLEAHQGYEMRVVRSRDLAHWEPSQFNHVLRASPEDKLIANAKLTEAQRARIALAVNVNNSDIDFCEWQGRLLINYSWGNQQGVEHLAEAVYDGSLAQFLSGWFAAP